MSCHSETGRVGIRRCIEINQRLHFRFTLPYQNRYFDTRPSPVGEVIRLPDLSCVETIALLVTLKSIDASPKMTNDDNFAALANLSTEC